MWGSSVHAAALVRPSGIVAYEVVVGVDLHLTNCLEPGAPPFDPEVLVKQCAVEAPGDAVGLGPLDARGAVFDLLKLQEELVGVLVRAAAVFPPISPSE